MIGSKGAVFGGFSVGGLVAFETARQLEANYGLPVSLFLIEPSAPGSAIHGGRGRLANS